MEYFHKRNKTNFALTAGIAIFTIAILAVMEHNLPNIIAEADKGNSTLFVSGSASNHTKPDKVIVSLGVETVNTTAQGALASNFDLTNTILGALKATGIRENETSTSTFRIVPNYNSTSNTNQGKLSGFTVANSISIESSNTESVSIWIDTAVLAGANSIDNVYFSLSAKKLDEIKNSLLKDAINTAKAKADIAANAAGLKVIGVKSIKIEDVQTPSKGLFQGLQSFDRRPVAFPSPIISGQQEVSANVSIIYEIG